MTSMPVNDYFVRCFLAVLLSLSTTFVVRSDELGNQAVDSSASEPSHAINHWHTNLAEAKTAANDSARPIMVVFR